MKSRNPILLLLVVAVIAVGVLVYLRGGGGGGFEFDNYDGELVAMVDEYAITDADVARRVSQMPPSVLRAPRERVEELVLEQLVQNRLLLIAGLDQGLEADPTVKKLVSLYHAAMIGQAYIETYVEERISEAALRDHYQETIGNIEAQREVHASHILVENEEDALALITELDEGADFAALARENSIGPSAPNGGDLGFFQRGGVVEAFADVVFALADGEITATPVQTEFGWHVVQVHEFRDAEVPPFEEVAEQMRGELTNDIIAAHLEELKAAADVEYVTGESD